jgi:alpha-galactosidase
MMGADIRKVGKEYRTLLQHKGLIALNQDAECRPAWMVKDERGYYVFVRHLADGEFAIGVFNFHENDQYAVVMFSDLGVPVGSGVKLALTDVMTGEQLAPRRDDLMAEVKGHHFRIWRAKFVD